MARCVSYAIICAFRVYSSAAVDSPYRAFNASVKTWISRKVPPPAWKSHAGLIGQRRSAGSIRRNDSIGGGAGPGLVSVLKPCAPPRVSSRYQYEGATYSYGPV